MVNENYCSIGFCNNWFSPKEKTKESDWLEFMSGTEIYEISAKPDSKYEIIPIDTTSFKIEYDDKLLFDTPLKFHPILPEEFASKNISNGYLKSGVGKNGWDINVYAKHNNGEAYGTRYAIIKTISGNSFLCFETDLTEEQIWKICGYINVRVTK